MKKNELSILVVNNYAPNATNIKKGLKEKGYEKIRIHPLNHPLNGNKPDIAIIHLSNDYFTKRIYGENYESMSEYLKDKNPFIKIIGTTVQRADYKKDFFARKFYDQVINATPFGDYIDRIDNQIQEFYEEEGK